MMLKKRLKPSVLRKLEALNRRIVPHLYDKKRSIEQDLANRYKGFIGEKIVDRYLMTNLPRQHIILPDIYLKMEESRFQIDTIVVTQYAIYLLEIKNFTGTIYFNTSTNQFSRIENNIEQGYKDPLTQVELQQIKLMQWLELYGFHDIPIYHFVVIASPSTILKIDGPPTEKITHKDRLLFKISSIEQQLINMKSPQIPAMDIIQHIQNSNQEYYFDVLHEYELTPRQIMSGIHCPKCEKSPMNRIYGYWKCAYCKHQSKNAHISSLEEFTLIYNIPLTNKMCRQFLHIQSHSLANRLLQKAYYSYDSQTKRWHPPKQ